MLPDRTRANAALRRVGRLAVPLSTCRGPPFGPAPAHKPTPAAARASFRAHYLTRSLESGSKLNVLLREGLVEWQRISNPVFSHLRAHPFGWSLGPGSRGHALPEAGTSSRCSEARRPRGHSRRAPDAGDRGARRPYSCVGAAVCHRIPSRSQIQVGADRRRGFRPKLAGAPRPRSLAQEQHALNSHGILRIERTGGVAAERRSRCEIRLAAATAWAGNWRPSRNDFATTVRRANSFRFLGRSAFEGMHLRIDAHDPIAN